MRTEKYRGERRALAKSMFGAAKRDGRRSSFTDFWSVLNTMMTDGHKHNVGAPPHRHAFPAKLGKLYSYAGKR
jgi:hypothetical protein